MRRGCRAGIGHVVLPRHREALRPGQVLSEQFSTDIHRGDQRDIFAYVLSVCGFHTESDNILHWPREWSYWSISDYLTGKWLATHPQDKELLKRGAESFERLLQYAGIHEQSARIIELNAARLYLCAQDSTRAKERIKNAVQKKDAVILKRIEIDPELRKVHSGISAT